MYVHATTIYTIRIIENEGFIQYAAIRVDGNGVKVLKTFWSEGAAWNHIHRLREIQMAEEYKRAACA